MRNSHLNMKSKRGFTLMELLIVISIIAILAIIAITSFKKTRESAATVKCMSNMRQVAGLIRNFAADNNNDLIPYLTYAPPNLGSTWLYWLWATEYLPRESYDGLWNGIMTCPARKEPGVYTSEKMQFGMNSYPGFDNKILIGGAFFKMSKVERPSQTALLADSNNWYSLLPENLNTVAFPHNGYNNVIFFDGHGEMTKGPWKAPTPGASYPFY